MVMCLLRISGRTDPDHRAARPRHQHGRIRTSVTCTFKRQTYILRRFWTVATMLRESTMRNRPAQRRKTPEQEVRDMRPLGVQ
jgi:hypothetical protein